MLIKSPIKYSSHALACTPLHLLWTLCYLTQCKKYKQILILFFMRQEQHEINPFKVQIVSKKQVLMFIEKLLQYAT